MSYRINNDDTFGVFSMPIMVKKWGNSASVRIPASVMDATRLKLDDPVDVRVEGGRIIIEPIRPHAFDLDQLLARITPENLHGHVDFGPAVGQEAL
jgi:antitoxin MazE